MSTTSDDIRFNEHKDNAQNVDDTSNTSSSTTTSHDNTEVKVYAERDAITITGPVTATTGGILRIGGGDIIINNYNHTPILDGSTLDSKEARVLAQLKAGYSVPEYVTIRHLWGTF